MSHVSYTAPLSFVEYCQNRIYLSSVIFSKYTHGTNMTCSIYTVHECVTRSMCVCVCVYVCVCVCMCACVCVRS